ncbi:MAG: beta-ketoacyl synthase [Gammaproteobacteria bacterium]|nr:beta-ketoacyl synthase [Gammaproteobacteria bacterium]
MANLPLIVGFGGINPAGRSSGHHGYRRLVIDQLPRQEAAATRASLASVMGLIKKSTHSWQNSDGDNIDLETYLDEIAPQLYDHTLIRCLENNLFDPRHLLFHKHVSLSGRADQPIEFMLNKKHLPEVLPPGWQVVADADKHNKLHVLVSDNFDVLLQCHRESLVNSAGQLPSGFDPGSTYTSRNHPRGLQLTVYGASDAINSLGIDWQTVKDNVAPDQISVYAGSGLGQLDYNGLGGMMQARLLAKKVSSKQLPLGYAEMPADFINAYVLGNLGSTGTNVAACATFLYNLKQGIRDIQMGTQRVVIVGTSEAPLMPEIFDGFATMGALADDNKLRKLDNLEASQPPLHRKACRPFGNNCGFTLAESAQFVVLFDDELALELGANIYGAVNEVFVNADGFKKSIAGPGPGNYITMAKAAAATKNLIGERGLQQRSYVQAHGTGTPQNRVTESHILNQVAGAYGIPNWPVSAVKSYVGHSLASAAGDQLMASLGVWEYGFIPGINTIDSLADDVHNENLDILMQHKEVDPKAMDAVLINSKGFGGNNATASILAPHIVEEMLAHKHGADTLTRYQRAREQTLENINAYDEAAIAGNVQSIYRFGENVLDSGAVDLNQQRIKFDGIKNPVSLDVPNSYDEFGK